MICLRPTEVPVRDSEPLAVMTAVEQEYVERFGAEPADRGGWYEPDGWKRLSRVFERLETGGHILDVGSGAGQFANCLARSQAFRSVTTIDPTRFSKYIELSDDIVRLNMSIAEMTFDDDAFDVVVCMEVLEHLPEEIFLTAIAELRRVCRGQLVLTVPYCEPEPLSATHLRRFEDDDFVRLFPHADFTILRRPQRPWMLVEEWPNRPVKRHATVDGLADDGRVAELQRQVAALQGRKALRTADWGGRQLRRAVTLARIRAVRRR